MRPEAGRRERLRRWLFALLALAVPALVAYIILQSGRPTLGILVRRRNPNVVYDVLPEGPAAGAGLRPGDVILAQDGVPAANWPDPQHGRVHTLEVERDGRRFTLAIPAVSMAQAGRYHLIPMVAVALILWSPTTLLLWRRFRRWEVRLLFLLSQIAAVTVLPFIVYPRDWTLSPFWVRLLSSTGGCLAPPMLLHFHLTFPIRLGTPRQRRWVLGLAYGLAPLVLATGIWGRGWWKTLADLWLIAQIVAAIAAMIYAYLRRATSQDRRRLRLIVFGTVLSLAPPILIYSLPSTIQASASTTIPRWLAWSFLVITPLSYLVATARHNLFDIDRLLNRTLVYGLLSLGIFILYLGPFLALYRFFPGEVLLQTTLVAGVTLVVGLSFNWTRTRVQRLVDRLFYGGWYDYPGVVETVSDALARSLDREQLGDVLTRQVPDLMQLHKGCLWIGEPSAVPTERAPLPQLQFPLTFEGQSRGLWTVGARRDGEDFTAADRRILQTLARQAETALSNVLLVETLRRQLDEIREAQHQLLRSREEERARLARDLHDGPIQSLVGLNLQLGLLLAPEGSSSLVEALGGMRAEVRELLFELRQVCAELRPPMLDTLGLGAALRALAEEWSGQHGAAIDLDLPPDASLRSLPEEVAVNLYRVAQEALSNVARHALAERVAVSLTWEPPQLTLTVQDNGQGFVAPSNLRDLIAKGHFGLAGMQERVNLIGGTLELDSAPAQGTTVRVAWQKSESANQRVSEESCADSLTR